MDMAETRSQTAYTASPGSHRSINNMASPLYANITATPGRHSLERRRHNPTSSRQQPSQDAFMSSSGSHTMENTMSAMPDSLLRRCRPGKASLHGLQSDSGSYECCRRDKPAIPQQDSLPYDDGSTWSPSLSPSTSAYPSTQPNARQSLYRSNSSPSLVRTRHQRHQVNTPGTSDHYLVARARSRTKAPSCSSPPGTQSPCLDNDEDVEELRSDIDNALDRLIRLSSEMLDTGQAILGNAERVGIVGCANAQSSDSYETSLRLHLDSLEGQERFLALVSSDARNMLNDSIGTAVPTSLSTTSNTRPRYSLSSSPSFAKPRISYINAESPLSASCSAQTLQAQRTVQPALPSPSTASASSSLPQSVLGSYWSRQSTSSSSTSVPPSRTIKESIGGADLQSTARPEEGNSQVPSDPPVASVRTPSTSTAYSLLSSIASSHSGSGPTASPSVGTAEPSNDISTSSVTSGSEKVASPFSSSPASASGNARSTLHLSVEHSASSHLTLARRHRPGNSQTAAQVLASLSSSSAPRAQKLASMQTTSQNAGVNKRSGWFSGWSNKSVNASSLAEAVPDNRREV